MLSAKFVRYPHLGGKLTTPESGRAMDEILCMIGECDEPPTREIVIDISGLLMIYTVCAEHKRAILAGTMFAQSEAPSRGLIGPA